MSIKDDIAIIGEKYEDIDPAIFDDPVLMLKWLDGKPQKESGLPPQPAQEDKVTAEITNTMSQSHTPKIKKPPDDRWEAAHIAAAAEVDVAENYASWLDSKVSATSKEELYQAYAIIEEYAYKYKLLTKPLLNTSDVSTIRNIQNLLVQKKEFRSMDATKRYICGLALRQFIQFLTEAQAPDETRSSTIKQTATTHSLQESTQSPDDFNRARDERARRWAEADQKEKELLESERQARARKWAFLGKK